MIDKVTYEDLLEQLHKAKQWLTDLGINVKKQRFSRIIDNVTAITRASKSNELSELIARKGNEELFYSLTESRAYVDIYNAFHHFKSDKIPKAKLRQSLEGPFLPKDECAGTENVNGRNILFELELAAKLIRKGIKIEGFNDIQFKFNNFKLCAQCKRLFSKRNIAHNINSAYKQLQPLIKDNSYKKGIIALSIEKIFNIDSEVFRVNNEGEIRSKMIDLSSEFIKLYRHLFANFGTQVIGMLFVIKFAVHVLDINLLTSGYELVSYALHPRDTKDGHLFHTLSISLI